ncbi:MAG: ABC transporter substrate-binding protein [Chloroflexota bacterium]
MKHFSKRIAVLILMFLILIPVLVTRAQDEKTTLTVGRTYLIDALNPTVGYYGFNIRGLLYETLVEAADGSNVEPGLAENWSVSDDGLVWTFKIREGATFSDGTPATAVEAAWTLNWIIDNQAPAMVSYLNDITKVEAPDATTLKITVDTPVSNMISSKLLYVYILPPHIWEGKSAEDITTFDDPMAVTVGAGPYHLTEYQPDEYMILDANENYWRGKPPVDRIIFRQYAGDDALIQALQAGEIDLIDVLPPSGVDALKSQDGISVLTGQGFQFSDLVINSSPDGTAPASLKDLAVREAIDHAIDRDQIATVGYLGYAHPAATFLSTASGDFFNSDLKPATYDIAAANKILDDAGYLDSDGDGIREDKDGKPMEYRLYTDDSSAYYIRILQIVSDGLAQIGISAPPLAQNTDFLVSTQIDYDFDIIYYEWNPDADPGFLTSVFTCAETADGGWNDSGYCNPDYDKLYDAQSTAVKPEDRKAVLWKIQEMIAKDRPWIMVNYLDALAAYRSDRFTFDPKLPLSGLKWGLFTGFSAA